MRRGFFVILINLVLSGDNAVVIAMAVNLLPREKRLIGLLFGSGLAVVLRIVLTIFAAELLTITGIKLIGGALIFWIAVKLLIEDVESEDTGKHRRDDVARDLDNFGRGPDHVLR